MYTAIDVDVPPGSTEAAVEVILDQHVDLDTTEGCLDGQAWASTAMSLDIYAMNPGGFFDLANDSPVVSLHNLFPWSVGDSLFERAPSPFGFRACHHILPPPILPAPFHLFDGIRPDPLRIPDPAAGGGRFLLVIGAHGKAQTLTDAQAWAENDLHIDEVVIRAR